MRNAIARQRKEKIRPSMIVGPNHDVLRQWRDEFVCNGFPVELMRHFQKGQDSTDFDKGVLLFATKYDLQAELKFIFDEIKKLEPPTNPGMMVAQRTQWYEDHIKDCVRTRSVLWPHLTNQNLVHIWIQFLADRGDLRKFRLQNRIRQEKEILPDCVTRLVSFCSRYMDENKQQVFETVVIDEVCAKNPAR